MVDQQILALVGQYLSEVDRAGIAVAYGVLFGSCARGEQNQGSDIDVLVVSPLFDRRKTDRDVALLWRLTVNVDARIEPVAVGVREYETDAWKPLLAMARHDGIVVYAPTVPRVRIAAEKSGVYQVDKQQRRAARKKADSPDTVKSQGARREIK